MKTAILALAGCSVAQANLWSYTNDFCEKELVNLKVKKGDVQTAVSYLDGCTARTEEGADVLVYEGCTADDKCLDASVTMTFAFAADAAEKDAGVHAYGSWDSTHDAFEGYTCAKHSEDTLRVGYLNKDGSWDKYKDMTGITWSSATWYELKLERDTTLDHMTCSAMDLSNPKAVHSVSMSNYKSKTEGTFAISAGHKNIYFNSLNVDAHHSLSGPAPALMEDAKSVSLYSNGLCDDQTDLTVEKGSFDFGVTYDDECVAETEKDDNLMVYTACSSDTDDCAKVTVTTKFAFSSSALKKDVGVHSFGSYDSSTDKFSGYSCSKYGADKLRIEYKNDEGETKASKEVGFGWNEDEFYTLSIYTRENDVVCEASSVTNTRAAHSVAMTSKDYGDVDAGTFAVSTTAAGVYFDYIEATKVSHKSMNFAAQAKASASMAAMSMSKNAPVLAGGALLVVAAIVAAVRRSSSANSYEKLPPI